ncbi:hypothetical protein K437DRAFT_47454 [Tilletiaria anomala UBC 951]|uniref:Uncharacterized protein n=1 Tax=Tilletiaria anomala (strain ATCC 24038 / CBS 436.72 / UBC 951) TaxID=1037660 RepID=A0A066V688_TILAU|nr:uncharacterized protein K437DRAFT_47454 [Tilletiaria anomala UBC 951]KDN36976.1 hypothetical protein K437DRAFT_47454 [Tilletiaria anomala UBC 951]
MRDLYRQFAIASSRLFRLGWLNSQVIMRSSLAVYHPTSAPLPAFADLYQQPVHSSQLIRHLCGEITKAKSSMRI